MLKTDSKKLETRDFISVGIFSLIYSVVAFVIGGVAQMTPVTFPFMPMIVALFISIYVKSPHGARLRTVVCARCSGERHSRVGGVQQHQPFQRRLPKKVWMHSERI